MEGNGTTVAYVSALAVVDESESFLFVVDGYGGPVNIDRRPVRAARPMKKRRVFSSVLRKS